MRAFFPAALAFALGACATREEAPRCDSSASRETAFTSQNATDKVETHVLGECGAVVALFVVRSHDGEPVWAWAAPAYPTFGDQFAPRPGPEGPTREDMRAFLSRWAAPEISRTSAAPAWSATLRTQLDRATYEDVRARDVPMLCHLAGVARYMCVYWESGVAGAGELYVREPPDSTEPTRAGASQSPAPAPSPGAPVTEPTAKPRSS